MTRRQPVRYDAVVKDLVQRDRSSILTPLLAGRSIRRYLNIEFSLVEERITDLVIELDDGSILHVEFQSDNHSGMPFRMGIYGLMIGDKYRGRKLEQAVIYIGSDKLTMADALDLGDIKIRYKLIDIRDHTVEELLATGHPADYVLAMLARDGVERLREILEKVLRLPGEERRRVLARMASLAGLRGAAEVLKMEVDDMGSFITLEDNVILRDIHDAAIATGRAEGRAEGMELGMTRILRRQIEQRFGPLPEWAESRIQSAGAADLERWASNVISAPDLESALG